jgi:hypothetical protein
VGIFTKTKRQEYKYKYNGRDEMRGSLHYAVHEETVNSFGRDDEIIAVWKKGDGNRRDKGNSRSPAGMTTRKTKTTAKAKAKAKMRGLRGLIAEIFAPKTRISWNL